MSAPAFAWALEQGAKLNLLPSDRLVLVYLADKANGARVCWPGQETIVQFTGLALRTVRAAIHRLSGLQLIRVDARPGIVTTYHILRPPPANGAGVHPGNPSQGTPAECAYPPRQDVPDHPETICTPPRDDLHATPAIRPPEPSKRTKKENQERKDPPNPPQAGGSDVAPPWFDLFWDLYPRKVGRRTATAAFIAAVNRGNDPAAIIAGLRGYRFHLDPQFQPHPTTWLRGDRWRDEVDDFDPVLRAVGLTPEHFRTPPPGGLLQ